MVLPKSVFNHGLLRPLRQLHLLELGSHFVPLLIDRGRRRQGFALVVRVEMPNRDWVLISSMDLSSLILGFHRLWIPILPLLPPFAPGNWVTSMAVRCGSWDPPAGPACCRRLRPPAKPRSGAIQPTSRCSTKNCAIPPLFVSSSAGLLIGILSFRALSGCPLRFGFDRGAVVKKTRSRSHHLLSSFQPVRNQNRTA